MKKKFLAGFLIALMVLTLVPAYAYADLNSDLEDINNQKDQVSNDMAELEDSLEKQKAELDEIEAAVSAKEAEIADSEAEIQATKEKIEQTKKDIEKREKELGLRLRTMYKNGSVGYIDVILGSGSLSEFLSNVSMVQRLYRSDQAIMEELENVLFVVLRVDSECVATVVLHFGALEVDGEMADVSVIAIRSQPLHFEEREQMTTKRFERFELVLRGF